jgi:RimJ/RimL family protein N-acetyltransferase
VAFDTNEFGQKIGKHVPDWVTPPYPARDLMEGRYVRLEPLDPAIHGGELFTAFSLDEEGRGWTYLPYGPFRVKGDFLRWVEQCGAGRDPQFFSLVNLLSGRSEGLASYLNIAPEKGSIEVGHIHFSPRMQKTPAATEAMFLMMNRAFDLGYRRYEWKCDALNEVSRRAAERLGFSFEGVFRQAAVVKGRNRDTAWYAIIDGDWPELRATLEAWLHKDNFDISGKQHRSLSEMTAL